MELTINKIDEVDFKKGDGLVPAIVQDAITDKVLMLGYMSKESLKETFERKLVTFYSRSRQELWTKGLTSGNFLNLKSIMLDCDHDTLLVKASPTGPVCHTGADTCFFEENDIEGMETKDFLFYLEKIVEDRRDFPIEGSYTNHLFSRGIKKIAQKVGEESTELVIESLDDKKDLLIGETADLLYHLQVLLTYKGVKLVEVLECLQHRHT
ncbi:MAG: bifunctional phosphoribosyl-AMP cyclohydrolase/phosphoribosyl-ATP diphosphatase HisIE [Sphaerochaetaceae bacterium]|nr:bifunctional phosphoribosyl-AMP cyclohydrolase/phosphoribosyl-ATP diphosphatase HisIE [Sphaerochaetaceae bacterium]MDC7238608.1 bifunctional phosphoribosyl-AMP cyclohydrolase/phosphoribosyl-ATP diphosphatase HisIE [Sphaerochaetaceae bacterium]MDC7248597.1 bifunctional phosphoribosyl-AMP cyclohydrolase/phosphoribosyl-ATP diphosphatase HisIE [Sphaerochaetaceae bacterium]